VKSLFHKVVQTKILLSIHILRSSPIYQPDVKTNGYKNDEPKQQRKVCTHGPVSISGGYVKELHDHAAADEADDDSEPGFS